MEDALALLAKGAFGNANSVLILVVMEDALALFIPSLREKNYNCLNPCCNGRCTRTLEKLLNWKCQES